MYVKQDGQLWLCADQAKQIWQALAEDAVFPSDREACFKWFSKLMGEEPDLDPAINKDFFENNILQLDPTLLTESGMRYSLLYLKLLHWLKFSSLFPCKALLRLIPYTCPVTGALKGFLRLSTLKKGNSRLKEDHL